MFGKTLDRVTADRDKLQRALFAQIQTTKDVDASLTRAYRAIDDVTDEKDRIVTRMERERLERVDVDAELFKAFEKIERLEARPKFVSRYLTASDGVLASDHAATVRRLREAQSTVEILGEQLQEAGHRLHDEREKNKKLRRGASKREPTPSRPNAVLVLKQIAGTIPGHKLHRISGTEAGVILDILNGPLDGRARDLAEALVRSVRSEHSRETLRRIAAEYVDHVHGKTPDTSEADAREALQLIADHKAHKLRGSEARILIGLLEGGN